MRPKITRPMTGSAYIPSTLNYDDVSKIQSYVKTLLEVHILCPFIIYLWPTFYIGFFTAVTRLLSTSTKVCRENQRYDQGLCKNYPLTTKKNIEEWWKVKKKNGELMWKLVEALILQISQLGDQFYKFSWEKRKKHDEKEKVKKNKWIGSDQLLMKGRYSKERGRKRRRVLDGRFFGCSSWSPSIGTGTPWLSTKTFPWRAMIGRPAKVPTSFNWKIKKD